LAMHIAIGLAMGMYLFALVMIVLNLAAFGIGISKGSILSREVPAGGEAQQGSNVSRLRPDPSPLHALIQPTPKPTSRIVLPPKRCFSFRRISALEICSSS